MRYLFLFLVLLTTVFSCVAQEKKLSLNVKNVSLISVLDQLESTFEIRFSYSDKLVSIRKISIQFQNKTLLEIIVLLNKKSNLNFEIVSDRNIIIEKPDSNSSIESANTQVLKEIILNDYLTEGIQKQKDGSYSISPQKLQILPGITEPDVFQSIQLLPGVISPDETSTNIHVRGGTPDQNLILWDGIKIYHTGHLFGTFSAFNPYITKSIKFINEGTNARYGDRISSVIDIKTDDDISNEFKGGFGFNLIEFDAYLKMPIIKNKLSIEVSGRRSFTDFLSSNTYTKISEKVFQNQNSEDILKGDNQFFYMDYSLKLNWKINENNSFHFSFINIENDLKTIFENPISEELNDHLETENQGYNLNWNKKWSEKWNLQTNVYFSNYALSFLHNEEIDTPLKRVNNKNIVKDIGLYLNFDYQLNKHQKINFGYQLSNYNIKYKLSNAQDIVLNNDSSINSHALYTSYTLKNAKLFDITGGLRFTFYSNLNDFEIEPRINIFKKLKNNFSVRVTAERKTQAVSQINETINQDLTLENQIWIIAENKQIPIVKSWQYTTGITYSANKWNLEMDLYYKGIEGLSTLNNSFIDIKDFKIQEGESNVIGADFYLKKRFNNYKTSVSYTLSSIKNNFEEINENQDFPSNTDITHNLNWLNEYVYHKFKFAFGWRWHSGKPYSKAIAIEKNSIDNNKLIYNGINNNRLPSYSRFDLSGTYNFNFSKRKKFNGKIGVSMLNIFNNENILNRSFSINNTGEKINTIETKSLSRVTNIVFRVSW